MSGQAGECVGLHSVWAGGACLYCTWIICLCGITVFADGRPRSIQTGKAKYSQLQTERETQRSVFVILEEWAASQGASGEIEMHSRQPSKLI